AGSAVGESVFSLTDSGDHKTYDVAVTATGDGTIIATVAQNLASDAAGNLNTASTSTDNSILYDSTPPVTASVTTPANGSLLRAATVPANFLGSVADAFAVGSGLNADSTTFTLKRGVDNLYWHGSTWQSGAVDLATLHTATTGNTSRTWTNNVALPDWSLESDGTFTAQATATDKAGNGFTGSAATFTLDNTPP